MKCRSISSKTFSSSLSITCGRFSARLSSPKKRFPCPARRAQLGCLRQRSVELTSNHAELEIQNFRGNLASRAASIFLTASLTFEADFWRVLLFDTSKSRVIRSRLKWLVFFEPQNAELFHIPHVLLVNAAGATQVEVAVVDSPRAIPEENND